MQARYVANVRLEALLDPDGAVWGGSRVERVKLEGTPIALQPTGAVRMAWLQKKIGAIEQVGVAAVHDGSQLAFRLEWTDATEDREITDTTVFPDAAAILLPAAPDNPACIPYTMGAVGAAVNGWYWHADEDDRGLHVVAEGVGTTRPVDGEELVRGHGVWKEGRWRVVISRALRVATAEPVAQLEPGGTIGFGVAIWDGSSGERGGIKAFSGAVWQELRLDPLPTARR